MARKSDYIAVFDSGLGGISVLRALTAHLPNERFLYFGDSANAPYGSRPTEQIRQLTLCAAEQLFRRGCKALVVACNTATAAAIEELRRQWPETIIIGIEPALKLAADRHPGGRIAVMATEATLRESKFSSLLGRFSDTCTVIPLPSPGLVEFIETGRTDAPECLALLHKELDPLVGQLDAVVLGCTHYPFLRRSIAGILGPEVELLDGGEGTARETQRRLQEANLLHTGPGSVILESSLPTRENLERMANLLHKNDK